jgi:hypothetical protein
MRFPKELTVSVKYRPKVIDGDPGTQFDSSEPTDHGKPNDSGNPNDFWNEVSSLFKSNEQ